MKERKIDINTFTRWEFIDRFCEIQKFDLVWQGDYLIVTERV